VAHPAVKNKANETPHATISTRPHDLISIVIEQTSALCSKLLKQYFRFGERMSEQPLCSDYN
jgi:hypothetical protein